MGKTYQYTYHGDATVNLPLNEVMAEGGGRRWSGSSSIATRVCVGLLALAPVEDQLLPLGRAQRQGGMVLTRRS